MVKPFGVRLRSRKATQPVALDRTITSAMANPEEQNEQKPSSADSPEQGKREREEERKREEPTDVGQAAEGSKRDTNA